MSAIVPFGKYKGQPVEVMASDREYVNWLLAQPWFAERWQSVYNVVIQFNEKPQDSPEHNRLQSRFLDLNLCQRALDGYSRVSSHRDHLDIKKLQIVRRVFEEAGRGDVYIEGCCERGTNCHAVEILIELKPTIGEDWPTVLRQAKAMKGRLNGSVDRVVICENYTGEAVSFQAVTEIYAASDVTLDLLAGLDEFENF